MTALLSWTGDCHAEVRVWDGGTTGDIYFMVIPEPSVVLLGGAGVLLLLRRKSPEPHVRSGLNTALRNPIVSWCFHHWC